MRIAVLVKAVPDLVEEIELTSDRTSIDSEYLTFVLNEWDAQALEEALLLKDATGAEVVAVGLADDPEIEQILFTALAKGADAAVKLVGTTVTRSPGPTGITLADRAAMLAEYLTAQPVDLVITGVQAPDDPDGQLPSRLAALLDLPHVSVVVSVETKGGSLTVRQEFAAGRCTGPAGTNAGGDRSPVGPAGSQVHPDREDQTGHADRCADRDRGVPAVRHERSRHPPDARSGDDRTSRDAQRQRRGGRGSDRWPAPGTWPVERVNDKMSRNVMVLAEHTGGQVSEGTYELMGKARELAAELGGVTEVVLLGPAGLADQLGGADLVVSVEHPALLQYVPEAYERALSEVLAQRSPRLLLMSNATVGLDLAAALSVRWDAPLAAYVCRLGLDGAAVTATAQILGGKVFAEVELPGERGIVTVLGGAFSALDGLGIGTPEIVHLTPPPQLDALRMSLLEVIEAAEGDLDITSAEMLVSVGRGIDSQENLEIVQELADALRVPLSGSRPVVDAGWLPKARQVGQSGVKVKPKAYLAFGISGAPEHLEGMRNAELIIACNTDAGAPIFGVAHYGTTLDLFDLVPELIGKVRD